MRDHMVKRILFAACTILIIIAMPLSAQGVSSQDYSGLDKYLGAELPDNASFVGVRAAEFLTIPVGARGIAMGSAYTAVADDISAIWWNPAGLGFLEKGEAMFSVADYTLDLTYSYAAFAAPVADGKFVLGAFFGYLDVPDIEVTTITRPEGTGRYYNAYDFQMGGSMAYRFSDRFVGGLNVKYVYQEVLNNLGGNAMAIDAGVVYHTELADREIKFSFSVQNLGTNIRFQGANLRKEVGPEDLNGNFPTGYIDYSTDVRQISRRNNRVLFMETHTYRLPTTVKMSLAYNLMTSDKLNWMVVGEFSRPNNIPITYAAGTEINYNITPFISAALRGGWQIQSDEYTEDKDQFGYAYLGNNPIWRGISFGGGIQRTFGSRHIRFNYAYRNKGRLSADNYFTFSFGF